MKGLGFFPLKRKESEPKFHMITSYSSTKYKVKIEHAPTGIIWFLESQNCVFPSVVSTSVLAYPFLVSICTALLVFGQQFSLGSSQVFTCTRIQTQRSSSFLKINWLNYRAPVSVFYCKSHYPEASKDSRNTLSQVPFHYYMLFSYGLLYMANREIHTECINIIG